MTNTTKYFLDTEFIEDGKTIDLISLGIVAESADVQHESRTLYLQNLECNFQAASDWVWRNVFPHLVHFDMRGRRSCQERKRVTDSGLSRTTITSCTDRPDDFCPWAMRREIRDRVLEFCSVEKYGNPEFWGYYADYDWVVFCQLFGPMVSLPKGFPMYCRDIKQWADYLWNPEIPKPDKEIHHALSDALWVKEAHKFLSNQPRP